MRRGTALLVVLLASGAAWAQDGERLKSAKALFFDHQYAEARKIWQEAARARGPEGDVAAFWTARCSEALKEDERALSEYDAFLARHPADALLAEEARTSRVGLAVQLYRAGRVSYLPVATEALSDPSRNVRSFAALQVAGLGDPAGRPAVPVLKRMVAEEKDPDLVDRAKLALLRLDPQALAGLPGATGSTPHGGFVRVRIYEKGKSTPNVSVNMPLALAELVFKSLPDDAKEDLRKKGYDADTFWQRLRALGPTEVLTVEGDDGERIQVWIE